MGFYTANSGLIGPGLVKSVTGVHDLTASRLTVNSLYDFTTATFTSGGVAEQFGPTLTQAKSGLTGPEVDNWKNNTEFFNTTGGIQIWTVPADGNYKIRASGAKGGGATGGSGAVVEATFSLQGGDKVYILVGQTGTSGSCGGGGGGGTFVARAKNLYNANFASFANDYLYPLVVGGGGGGQRDSGSSGPQTGSMGNFGTFPAGAQASMDGFGGPGGATNGAGGWSTDGGLGSTSISNRTSTGRAFINGGEGSNNSYSVGKFGGGAGGTCNVCNTAAGAGPGGGYSGGGTNPDVGTCYTGGGGGGSFIHSTCIGTPGTSNGSWTVVSSPHSVYSGSVSVLGSFNTGSGAVVITRV